MIVSMRQFAVAAALVAAIVPCLFPSGTATWEMNSYSDFVRGRFEGISLSISARDDAEAKRMFNALGDGGKVTQPLTNTFFASSFGSTGFAAHA